MEPINYIESNIQENDMIVIANLSGFVTAVDFPDNQVYFYNKDNWNVEEAYKAFGPNYETVATKDFVKDCSNRVWIVDDPGTNTYDDLFKNNGYNIISENSYFTDYHGYCYKITLVER